MQRFAERQIIGTARYVGMGGAMTAIGGDPSAVIDNPAGLGLYRRSEIALTVDETIDRTQQVGSEDTYQRARFAAPHVSAIWAWGNPMKQSGMIYNNFMFSVNRLANFNRDVVVSGRGMGMAETICQKTNGLAEEYLYDKPWDDIEIGWLSILGYEGYLIDPHVDSLASNLFDKYAWIPAIDFADGTLSVSESGTYDQYTLSWASNISNQWYIGVSLNIPTLSYTKHVSHRETDRINSAELKSMYHLSGLGVSGSIGLIYRPIQALRIGASFETPTMMSLSMQTEGDMYSTLAPEDILTPESGIISTEMVAPLRTSVSVAGQLGSIGLLALQYDLIVFRLGGWSPLLPTGFHVSRGTLVQATCFRLPLQDCHSLWSRFPTGSGQLFSVLACPQPRSSVDHRFGLFPLRSPLLRKSSFLSSPPGT